VADAFAGVFFVAGSFVVLLGALAVLRFPDLFCRLSGSSLGGTVGLGLMLAGLVTSDPSPRTIMPVLLLLVFLLLTIPLSGYIIARVAYGRGSRPAKLGGKDRLEGRFRERSK
jgi:multicomponent Na+:H+ antiporter subunit G